VAIHRRSDRGGFLACGRRARRDGAGVASREKVSACALQADPAAYGYKMIEVRGVVSHGFEDFTLSDPRCERRLGIW